MGLWTGISGVVVLVAAMFGARSVGRALQSRSKWWFLGANVAVVILAAGLVLIAFSIPQISPTVSDVLYGAGLGLGFGYPAGLRQGYKGAPGGGTTKGRV
jgi:uncharacterized membrane protein